MVLVDIPEEPEGNLEEPEGNPVVLVPVDIPGWFEDNFEELEGNLVAVEDIPVAALEGIRKEGIRDIGEGILDTELFEAEPAE